jgi:hypothetical protein
MMAPMVAAMMDETMPAPRWMPSCGNNQLPMRAPMMPMPNIGDDAVAGAPNNLSGKPSCNQADQQNDENRFVRHRSFSPIRDLRWSQTPDAPTIANARHGGQRRATIPHGAFKASAESFTLAGAQT